MVIRFRQQGSIGDNPTLRRSSDVKGVPAGGSLLNGIGVSTEPPPVVRISPSTGKSSTARGLRLPTLARTAQSLASNNLRSPALRSALRGSASTMKAASEQKADEISCNGVGRCA